MKPAQQPAPTTREEPRQKPDVDDLIFSWQSAKETSDR
jgi:hypothetical protein